MSGARERGNQQRTDFRIQPKTCPVCSLHYMTRYWDERKKLFIYKHSKLHKGAIKRWTETTYHEANR